MRTVYVGSIAVKPRGIAAEAIFNKASIDNQTALPMLSRNVTICKGVRSCRSLGTFVRLTAPLA